MITTQQELDERVRELERQERDEAIRWLLATPQGRFFAWALMEEAGTFQASFAGEQPLTMAMNEGRRLVGNFVLHKVFTSGPNLFSIMGREAEDRHTRYVAVAEREIEEE